jgi:hypothetical protein
LKLKFQKGYDLQQTLTQTESANTDLSKRCFRYNSSSLQ